MRPGVVEGPGAEVVGDARARGVVGGGCRGFEKGLGEGKKKRRLDFSAAGIAEEKRKKLYAAASVPFCFAPFLWRSFLNMLIALRTKIERESVCLREEEEK